MNKTFNTFNTVAFSALLSLTLFLLLGFRSLKMPPSTMITAVVMEGANPVSGASMQGIGAVSGTQFACSGSCTSEAGGNANPTFATADATTLAIITSPAHPSSFLPWVDLWVGGKTTPINKTVTLAPVTGTKLSVQFSIISAFTYPIQINVIDLPTASSGTAPKTVMSQTIQKPADLQNFQAVAGHIYTVFAVGSGSVPVSNSLTFTVNNLPVTALINANL